MRTGEGWATLRHATRSSLRGLAAAIILAGCQAFGSTPRPATPPASAPPTGAPTATPIVPPPTPAPTTNAGVPCPDPLPTDVASIVDLGGPACFGTTELTLEGWLAYNDIGTESGETAPSWTMSMSSLYAARPTVRQYVFDYLLSGSEFGLRVVTPPETAVDLSGAGRSVRLRGHFNDPVALACTHVDPELAADPDANKECDQLFVVDGLEETEHPAPDCPTASPMDLPTYLDATALCFVGRQVQLTGWEDVGEGFGGVSLAYPIDLGASLDLAGAQLVSERWETGQNVESIFPWLVSGSGVSFDRSDAEVVVTGQLGHPAALDCRPGDQGWTWTPPVAWAQERCQHLFVITAVGDRD